MLRLHAERLAGELRGVRRAHLRARQARVDLHSEPLQGTPRGARLPLALLGEWPLRVRRSVGGVPMAQQPQHDASPYRYDMEAVTAPREVPALDSPELYANRELSWLQFNERVLELAEDERTPLLERVKFLVDLRVQPRRVLHGAGGRPARPGGRRDRRARARRAVGARDARAHHGTPRELCDRHSRRLGGRGAPRAGREGIRVVDMQRLLRRPSSRAPTGCSPSRSSRCSRRWPSARGGRSRTSRTCRCRSACLAARPGLGGGDVRAREGAEGGAAAVRADRRRRRSCRSSR